MSENVQAALTFHLEGRAEDLLRFIDVMKQEAEIRNIGQIIVAVTTTESPPLMLAEFYRRQG